MWEESHGDLDTIDIYPACWFSQNSWPEHYDNYICTYIATTARYSVSGSLAVINQDTSTAHTVTSGSPPQDETAQYLPILPASTNYHQISLPRKDLPWNNATPHTTGYIQPLSWHLYRHAGCPPWTEDGSVWDQRGNCSSSSHLASCYQHCSGSHDGGRWSRRGFKAFASNIKTTSAAWPLVMANDQSQDAFYVPLILFILSPHGGQSTHINCGRLILHTCYLQVYEMLHFSFKLPNAGTLNSSVLWF